MNLLSLLSSLSISRHKHVSEIKTYAVACLSVYQMMKYFALVKNNKPVQPGETDTDFYNQLDAYFQENPIIAYYNELRNYLTKKNFLGRLLYPAYKGAREQKDERSKRSTDGAEKMKLSFEKGTLLGGWAESPPGNAQYNGFILRKGDSYFLAISDSSTILDKIRHPEANSMSDSDFYEKMTYKQLKSQTIYGSSYVSHYHVDYQSDKKSLSSDEIVMRMKRILAGCVKDYPQLRDIINTSYKEPNELAKAVNSIVLYSVDFSEKISSRYVEQGVYQQGKPKQPKYVYLFKITTQDLVKKSKGMPNLHSQYFLHLFSAANLQNPLFKLSGGGEIFFRPKNTTLAPDDEKNGKPIFHKRRYKEDKFFIHIPIVLNMGAASKADINDQVLDLIQKRTDIKIIGIDRGEKHLAYFAIIGSDGSLVGPPESLNNPLGTTDYNKLLLDKAGKRDEARKNWKTIETIKDLKKGYISQVVRKISDLIIEHNAIVVLEDLNFGFKRSRQKMENQVYQKLELALAQKFNYLVNKNTPVGKPGHYLSAYQLTPQVGTYHDIARGKQCGVIFYTTADYTSVTCPACGFRKNIYLNFENMGKARSVLSNIKIGYNDKRFSFTYNPNHFDNKNNKGSVDHSYTIYSDVRRIRWFRKEDKDYAVENSAEKLLKIESEKGYYKDYDLTECFRLLLQPGTNLSTLNTDTILEHNWGQQFYRSFIFYFKLLLQLRNSTSEGTDYISCPACGFHSDKGFKGYPWNGDANGAYNIARKGLIILEKIRIGQKNKDLKITAKEWDQYLLRKKPDA